MQFLVFSYLGAAISVNRMYTLVYYNIESVVSPQKVAQPTARQRYRKPVTHY